MDYFGQTMPDPMTATAYWSIPPGRGELREEPLRMPGAGEALVRAVHSGISRGTELLVHNNQVPAVIADEMRAPHQVGDFGGPVKYGYLSVGVVEEGQGELLGAHVFCLHPHQDRYLARRDDLHLVPPALPLRRAVLAGAMETAINALWDAGPRLGDRIAIVGGGLIGGALAGLLRTFPLESVLLLDVNPDRAAVAEAFGVHFAHPDDAWHDLDVVFHTSATSAGLSRSLELAGREAEVIELSWYGARETSVALGAEFHSRRLTLRASQVSAISASRRARRTHQQRLLLALDLLRDDAYDVLISGSSPFSELPVTMQRLATGELDAICHVIDY